MWPFILTGFSIGVAGSLHCIGMCGPLAIVMPWASGKRHAINILLYHSGRSMTYLLLGLCFGLLGNAFYIAGYQQLLSVLVGFVVCYIALRKILPHKIPEADLPFFKGFRNGLYQLISRKGIMSNPFLFGLANGLLPCGLVYLAVAAAVSTGNILGSAMVMTFFGLGTVPVFSLFLFGMKKISMSLRNRVNKAIPYVVLLSSFLLILRGLNLGIPYVSPYLNVKGTTPRAVHCIRE